MRKLSFIAPGIIGIGIGGGFALAAPDPGPPATAKRPVENSYHGVKIVDDYQWLENTAAPEVDKWAEAQNAHARAILDAFPGADAIRARLNQVVAATTTDYRELQRGGALLFAYKAQTSSNQPLLVTLASADDPASEHVILDTNHLDPSGHTAIDFFVPSLDGKMVAVSLSRLGSEAGDVHVFDVAGGKETGDVVPHVNGGTAGGSLSWNGDGSGFYYTRYPKAGERPAPDLDFYQQIYFHKLGTPESADSYAAGKDFPRIAEIELDTSPDGRFITAEVKNGDGGEMAYYLAGAGAGGKFAQVSKYEDKIVKHKFGRDGALYLLSRKDAPRGKVLRLAPGETSLDKAAVLVPQGTSVVEDFQPTASKLYLLTMVGGPDQLGVLDLDGKAVGQVPILPVSTVDEMLSLTGDDILIRNQSYVTPAAWLRYDAQTGEARRTKLFRTSPSDYSGFEVLRDSAVSKDGTKVPMTIVRKKGLKLDGKNPTLLYAYGAYGLSLKPTFNMYRGVLLEQGVVYVEANIRGGGEMGEEWHLGGNLLNKQNDYDDFYAVAKHLVDAKYTAPRKLAILGGSNGGLLMGVVLTQHPEAFGAVVAAVGIFDQLRTELEPNGEFNVTEFGTVKDEAQFKAMYAYSPMHHVVEGQTYPPLLLLTGLHDKRVAPWQSFKMAARMQAATHGKSPVLLRINPNAGHGIGTSTHDKIEEWVDIDAFILRYLGVAYKPVKPGRG